MARNRKTPDWRVPCFAFAAACVRFGRGQTSVASAKLLAPDSMECGMWIAELSCSDCLQLCRGLDIAIQLQTLLGKEHAVSQDAVAW